MHNEQSPSPAEESKRPHGFDAPHIDQMFPDYGELPSGVSRERFGDRAEEIGYLVQLANLLEEVIDHPTHGPIRGADQAADLVGMYGQQVAINDPVHARNLVEALEWRGNRDAAFRVAGMVRDQLGLPPMDRDDRGFAG